MPYKVWIAGALVLMRLQSIWKLLDACHRAILICPFVRFNDDDIWNSYLSRSDGQDPDALLTNLMKKWFEHANAVVNPPMLWMCELIEHHTLQYSTFHQRWRTTTKFSCPCRLAKDGQLVDGGFIGKRFLSKYFEDILWRCRRQGVPIAQSLPVYSAMDLGDERRPEWIKQLLWQGRVRKSFINGHKSCTIISAVWCLSRENAGT